MGATLLEQSVLRAQPTSALGLWEQNFYFNDRSMNGTSRQFALQPYICPSSSRSRIVLPAADSFGSVGYIGPQLGSASVTVWQYKSTASAKQALKQFRAVSCPDSPLVRGDDDKYHQAQGGSDFSASTVAGVHAYGGGYAFTSPQTGTVATIYQVRPVGQAIIRVEILLYGPSATPQAQVTASAMATNWIDAASKAVMKYSSMDPHAA